MNLHVVSVEHFLTKPDPLLGDELMSPLFHRVSDQCPVLHLFGYVYTSNEGSGPQDGINATVAAGGASNSIQQRSVCAHIHGVYPYFMVLRHDSRVSVMQFGAQLEAVALRVLRPSSSSTSAPPRQLLHHVELVRRLPFYGYHERFRSFFRVSVIDPAMVGRLVRLLGHTTEVGGRRWQTYESHAPYHFQFMVDYGMKGMAPFFIPTCTARFPIAKELQHMQAQARLKITAVTSEGEPMRLTRAELEIDVRASALRRRESSIEMGENLLSVRRSVRQYFAECGVDDALRCGAASDTSDRNCTVCDVQNSDLAVSTMRQRALTYLRARADTATAEPLSHMTSTPRDELEKTTNFSLSAGTLSENLTMRLMEEMHGDRAESAPFSFSVSSTSFSSPSVSVQSVEDMIGDNGGGLLLSSEDDCVQGSTLINDNSLAVGDSIVLFDGQADGSAPRGPLIAKITGMEAQTVRLRWYMTIRETHLADTQAELERNGRWLARGVPDAGGSAAGVGEELLLGDVEDENPIDVLKQSVRVVVCHSYHAYKSPALLCRYKYHVLEQRLSAIEPARDEDFVALPAVLSLPTAGGLRAGVVAEDEELLASSSSSAFSSSSPLCVKAAAVAPETHVLASHSPSIPSMKDGKYIPVPLRRSVSSVVQQAAQSQLSMLLSCIGKSPSSTAVVHSVASLPGKSVARAPSEPSSSSSSIECVNSSHAVFFQECGENTSCLHPCYFMGDIPRNFRWKYDQHKKSVLVSAATWPLATPAVPVDKVASADALKGRGALRATAGPIETRPSVPLLSQVAPSQWGSPDHQPASGVKPKWQPHPSSNASRSVDRGAYKTCDLRVMCVEVLIHRRRGTQNVAQEELLAVALGRTSSFTESVGVRLFCVGPPKTPIRRLQQPFSGVVDVFFLPSEFHLLRQVRQELCFYDPDIILSWDGSRYGVGPLERRYRIVLQRSFAQDFSRLAGGYGMANGKGEEAVETDALGDCASDGDALFSSPSSPSSLFSVPSVDGVVELPANKKTSRAAAPAAPLLGVEEMVRGLSRRFGGSDCVPGRVVVDLGRQLRKEMKLPSQTLQMVYQKLFHSSLPYFTDAALTEMYTSRSDDMRRVALSVLLTRVVTPHRIAQHLRFYTRVVEFSRMYGILFYEVLSRGSQYRVEATLHNMTKPMGYAMLSPSPEEVHHQPSLVSMPLIMQPRSDFYKDDPIVVLDFRSLYPSIIIAYNLCYSTCLGKVSKHRRGRLGVLTSYKQADPLLLRLLAEDDMCPKSHRVTFAPNGCMFLSPEVRKGVLPQMLQALLDTRLEVLAAFKHVAQPSGDKYMQRILQEQQTAIKMLANTTYGYTAASFTGRMPCVDVADATVMLGRQTLERAMRLINIHPGWDAEVVYGDTDSLFVRLPGRTKEEAFLCGEQMAREVSRINPTPIQLQLEKVLFPCLLLAKKRYVGYAYYKPDQTQPQFFARGIETVRRDQCPATSRLAECMIHLLFSGASTNELRARFYEEVGKLQRGACNPADCIFRKSVKLGRYHDETRLPPGAQLAMRLMEKDFTRTPYWGERLPYVVVQPMASVRLCDRVIHPQRLLDLKENLRIDHEYYITRHIIPTLDRMFYLIGVSFANWYALMPKRRSYHSYFELGLTKLPLSGRKTARTRHAAIVLEEGTEVDMEHRDQPRHVVNPACFAKKGTLDAYYQQTLCAVCLEKFSETTPPDPPVCGDCLHIHAVSVVSVIRRRCSVERHLRLLETACRRCIGSCGEAGGPNFLAGKERDMEDMHFAVPHQLAAASSAVNGEESTCCLSVDCHLSFEKRQVFLLYSQLMALEHFLTSL
ncbi:DNA polymerase zeta catalytic subunit [Trypanosoma cruzi]|nr:DNA polymerase zeta catalytic subunit [Trypanosoma cruzi]